MQPLLDVSETEAAYTVKLDVPGVPKDAVKINIEGRRVTIDAEQSRDTEKKEGERVLYRERSVSASRSFTLPQEINQPESSAALDPGCPDVDPGQAGRSTATPSKVN